MGGGGGLRQHKHQHYFCRECGAEIATVFATQEYAQNQPHHVTGNVQTGLTAWEGVAQDAGGVGAGFAAIAATTMDAMSMTSAVPPIYLSDVLFQLDFPALDTGATEWTIVIVYSDN